jgi:hypothetical protein
MYKLLAAIRRQLYVLFASRLGLTLLALFVGMSVFTAAIYQKLVVRELPVVVIDLDRSQLSLSFARY